MNPEDFICMAQVDKDDYRFTVCGEKATSFMSLPVVKNKTDIPVKLVFPLCDRCVEIVDLELLMTATP